LTVNEAARAALQNLTLRDIHRHFSEEFGSIHRMYVGRNIS